MQTHMLRRMTSQFNDTFYFISADGLKCYECLSTSSWGNCSQKEMTCASGLDTCAKVYVKGKVNGVSVTEYAKRCSTREMCLGTENSLCKREISAVLECRRSCCKTDLCNTDLRSTDFPNTDLYNTAAIQVINVIFLILCAFLASVLMQ